MGAYHTDHENNKITQEHWRDLISAGAVEARISTHARTRTHIKSPAPAREPAVMIVRMTIMRGTGLHPHLDFEAFVL